MPRKKYPKPIDCFSNPIELGDTVVYPVRRGAVLYLRSAVVSEVPGKGCTVKKGVVALSIPIGRRVIIETPERCAIVRKRKEQDA